MAGVVAAIVVLFVGLVTLQSWTDFRSFMLWGGWFIVIGTVVPATLLFFTGGLLGDQLEKRRSKLGKSQRDAEAREYAQATASRMTGSDEGIFYKVTVEILKLLQPFAPVITRLLGIIGPLLLFYLSIK